MKYKGYEVGSSVFEDGQDEVLGRIYQKAEEKVGAERIADFCRDDLAHEGWILPEVDVPAGHTCDSWLAKLAHEGLTRNYAGTPQWAKAHQIQQLLIARQILKEA